MRKIPAAIAVLSLAAVGLTGCSLPAGASACPRPAVSDPDVMDLVTVTGAPDSVPDVSVYAPLHTTENAYEDLVTGTGPAITSASQLAVLDVTLLGGDDGDVIGSTAYSGDLSSTLQMSQVFAAYPGLEPTLMCATEGSRVAVVLAPDGIEAGNAARLGLGADESVVAVLDLRKVYLAHAEGSLQFNAGNGLPSVVRAPDGRPGVIVPDGAAPDAIVVQTLIKGDGEEATGDRPVRVNYTAVDWADKSVSQTTWSDQPESMSFDAMPDGWADALTGQTVGSQVMIVVPTDAASGGEPDATVYVIDILGLDQPAS